MAEFPGATAPRADADYIVTGAPLDRSTTFQPGTRFGPREIRHFATPFDDYDHRTDQHFSELGVHDAGDLDAWDDVEEYLSFLTGELTDIVEEGATPVLMGGEHTVSYAGVEAVSPSVFVVIDAHLDLREEYGGNPLSHATVINRIAEIVDEVVILGARTGNEAEWERAATDGITVVSPVELPDWDPSFGSESVYLSVDIDAVDPSAAPGTGTMEPFGVTPHTVRDVVTTLAPACRGFDVVEVNDRDDGQTAALAAKLLRRFVYTHAASSSA